MDAIKLTAEEILKAYVDAGLSTKRQNRAQATNTQMPAKGTFAKLDFSTYTTEKGEKIKYPVLVVMDANGKEIGNIAVGTILQQISANKARKVTRVTSDYVGKWFHASRPLSVIPGNSEIEQISGLIGRTFVTKEKRDQVVSKIVLTAEGKAVLYDTETEALNAVENKDCYQIVLND